MKYSNQIVQQLKELNSEELLNVLLDALQWQKDHPESSPEQSIYHALQHPLFPKVAEAVYQEGHTIQVTFQHGRSGWIDFTSLLNPDRAPERQLLDDPDLFRAFKVDEGTLVWPKVGKMVRDFDGNEVFFPFDIDPELLYQQLLEEVES